MSDDDMRLAFEGWAEARNQYLPLYREGDGYGALVTQTAWDAWQAATRKVHHLKQEST